MTMVSYSLARFGHDNVLDGGLQKWKDEGKEVDRVFPEKEGSSFWISVREEYVVGYGEFKAIKDRGDVIVLDARPTKFYEGESPWSKPGHIPGAVNLP
ncbi:MAG TPA: rhodanese-like domain-containing protein [Methanothrix sp.]|nr:rhodanese-like domain-containing protein [Methanothrix sp.]HPJ84607.1 rhodanese-like domain-containing protein [Methanothrix sp.]HPR65823.1 rhodanese-like domain-containing protein [Methanothrix sp.]